MQILIHTLHVLQRHLLSEHHLVESSNKERVQEPSVENGQTDYPANELEVIQMFGVDPRVRVDLKGIVIVGRVFEEAVEGVEHFVR